MKKAVLVSLAVLAVASVSFGQTGNSVCRAVVGSTATVIATPTIYGAAAAGAIHSNQSGGVNRAVSGGVQSVQQVQQNRNFGERAADAVCGTR